MLRFQKTIWHRISHNCSELLYYNYFEGKHCKMKFGSRFYACCIEVFPTEKIDFFWHSNRQGAYTGLLIKSRIIPYVWYWKDSLKLLAKTGFKVQTDKKKANSSQRPGDFLNVWFGIITHVVMLLSVPRTVVFVLLVLTEWRNVLWRNQFRTPKRIFLS